MDFFDHIFGREVPSAVWLSGCSSEVCVNGTLNFSKFMEAMQSSNELKAAWEAILKLRQTNECTIKDMVDLRGCPT